MANQRSFPLVRGRTMRVTRMDGCCRPLGGPDSQVVTDGFVSVALTANITQPEEITVINANGQTCVRDPGCPEFNGYGVELTFCEVNPCLFSMVTGALDFPIITASPWTFTGYAGPGAATGIAAGRSPELPRCSHIQPPTTSASSTRTTTPTVPRRPPLSSRAVTGVVLAVRAASCLRLRSARSAPPTAGPPGSSGRLPARSAICVLHRRVRQTHLSILGGSDPVSSPTAHQPRG